MVLQTTGQFWFVALSSLLFSMCIRAEVAAIDTADTQVLAEHANGVKVTTQDLAFYFSEYGSGATAAIEKVPNIEMAIEHIFVIKTLAERADSADMIDNSIQRQIAQDAVDRELMAAWVDSEVRKQISAVDWGQLAREEYLANAAVFNRGEEFRASHILFEIGDRTFAEAVVEAEAVRQRALAGEPFDELARQHSQSEGAANGGDLGYFGRGRMVPEFEKAAFALGVGEISDLVHSSFGLHIIKVTDRRDLTTMKFEDVEAQILKKLETKIRRELRATLLSAEKSQLVSDEAMINQDLIEQIRSGEIKLSNEV